MNSIKINKTYPREFHVWDLPDYVRVSLKNEVRKELFDILLKSTKTIRQLRYLIQKETNKNIANETLRGYIIGKYFIPLWFLNKVVELFFDGEFYFNLEKQIIAFRGPRGDAIYSPNFPWKEDERIIRIVFRLIGDGHGGGDVCKGRVPVYANTCDNLTNQFISDLEFFGQTKIRKYERTIVKNCKYIEFPKVVGHILKHLYQIDFMGKTVRLTNELYSLPRKLVIEGIKVYGDDEGSVKGTEIHFYSSNKELLKDFKKLFKFRLPEFKTVTNVRLNVVKTEHIKTYYIAILAEDLEKYYNLIGFLHPLKQRKLLHQLNCQRKVKNNRGDYLTKELILKSLLDSPKTSYQISEKVLVNHRTVNKHINGYSDKGKKFKGLYELGLIKPYVKSPEGIVWELTEKGGNYKFSKGCLIK